MVNLFINLGLSLVDSHHCISITSIRLQEEKLLSIIEGGLKVAKLALTANE
jgi:hypothetical protein